MSTLIPYFNNYPFSYM